MAWRNRTLTVIGLSLLLLGAACTLAAAQGAIVEFLTPETGPLGDITAALRQELAAGQVGTTVIAALPEEFSTTIGLVTDDDHLADEATRTRLLAWVRAGGGLVLLVQPGEDHYAQATQFLEPLGAQVSELGEGDNRVRLASTPVTQGLTLAGPVSVRMKITGTGLRPLAWAGNQVALAQIPAGAGGVIVLPASLLLTSLRQRPPDPAPLTLAARATLWANRPFGSAVSPTPPVVPPPTPPATLPPAAATSLPLETTDFAGITLYDCRAADDSWPQINDLVQGLLRDEGFEMKALDIQLGASSLVAALQSQPKLAVLGTWRQLSEAETIAIYYYVLGGGRLLALANATTATQVRLTYLNSALTAFGVVVSLGRPAGATSIYPASPLKDVLHGPDKLPAGIQVDGDGAMKALLVDRYAALATARRGAGRLLVLDARPLVDSAEYRADLKEGIKWLFSPET